MQEMQMLFPMDPKEFWKQLKIIVEEAVNKHNNLSTELKIVKPHNDNPLLKATEVCAIFKISKPTLYEWMKQGKIPSVKIESRRFFKRTDIEELINNSKVRQKPLWPG